ncbi:MAG: hypothetical protein ACI83E_002834, partial [Sulfitobacter sp.]
AEYQHEQGKTQNRARHCEAKAPRSHFSQKLAAQEQSECMEHWFSLLK